MAARNLSALRSGTVMVRWDFGSAEVNESTPNISDTLICSCVAACLNGCCGGERRSGESILGMRRGVVERRDCEDVVRKL